MRNIVIIVPGSKMKRSRFGIINLFLDKIYGYLRMDRESTDAQWTSVLKKHIEQGVDIKVCVFFWSGGISRKSVKKASEELKDFVKSLDNANITIFAKSMGGVVGEYMLEDSACREKVKKFIYVASPHRKPASTFLTKEQVFNIYSRRDRCMRLAHYTLFWGDAFRLPNAHNIEMNELYHDDFNRNSRVMYKVSGRDIFDAYKEVII